MKEAIGTSLVFNLMMIFIGVMIVIFLSAISYSKAFKIRNKIIDRIEEHSGYTETAASFIENDLKGIGYKIVKDSNCSDKSEQGGTLLTSSYNTYNYCVYEFSSDRGFYYGVTVFISVDIPLIGDKINVPVYGESRVIYKKGSVEN